MSAGFPNDPDFPELAAASDPSRMLDVFRTHLQPVSEKAYEIDACAPVRFRCRQSTSRCVLQYALRLRDPSTGASFDHWVTGVLYAPRGEARRRWQELERAVPTHTVPERWRTFQPVCFIPELEMVVQVFPYDRGLPSLGRVLAAEGSQFAPVLEARAGAGEWRPAATSLELLRYRTEIGAALRYTVRLEGARTGRDTTARCYVKVCRPGRGAATFRLMQALAAEPPAADAPYGVVRPLAYLDELQALVVDEAPGTALLELLARPADPTPAIQAAGRALAAFHLRAPALGAREPLATELRAVERAAALLAWACPDVGGDVRAIAATVIADLEDASTAPIHGDLKAEHIFVAGDRVTFIDFDRVALGDPVRDAAHLSAYLTARVGLDAVPEERGRAAADALVDAYFAHVPTHWRERFALHRAGALLEVASGIFRSQQPGWPDKLKATVAHALDAVAPRWR